MTDVLSLRDLAALLALTEEGRGEEPGPIMPWFLSSEWQHSFRVTM